MSANVYLLSHKRSPSNRKPCLCLKYLVINVWGVIYRSIMNYDESCPSCSLSLYSFTLYLYSFTDEVGLESWFYPTRKCMCGGIHFSLPRETRGIHCKRCSPGANTVLDMRAHGTFRLHSGVVSPVNRLNPPCIMARRTQHLLSQVPICTTSAYVTLCALGFPQRIFSCKISHFPVIF